MPEKTDVLLGGTKRFECRVIGYPRPEIKWYKDGVEITSNKRYNFTFTREGVISMLIQQVSRQDEGCYRCRASNSEGMASTAAYLFVRTKKSKFLEDTPLVHSMSFGEATDKDLEHDKEFKTKEMEKRKEEETMETEEYEHKITMETEEIDHRITMEEQSDILKGREVSDDVISGTMEQRAVTLTEITSESESSFSSVEHMKGSKETQDELEKVAKMYGEVMDSEKTSIEVESQSKIKSKEESLTVESEVSIEEKQSKTIEISSDESKSVTKEVSITSSVTKKSIEEKSKLEGETKKKEEQLSDLESEIKGNQLKGETKSRLDISVEVEETKTLTQTADDSGLGLSFTADMDEKSFVEQNNSLITTSSSEIAGETISVKTELHESSKFEETTEISAEVKTETKEAKMDQDMTITAETSIEKSSQKEDLSFDATVTTDSSEIKSLEVSTEVKTEEKASLKLEAKQEEELLEKKLEETECLHGETVPEKLSERVSTPQDLILPNVGVAEYKAEELGEQQSVSSIEDLSSEQFTEPKTGADEYYGERDLVLPIVRQAPVYKTEELKDQLSEGSFEDLSFDETSQSEPDVKVENEPVASSKAFVESQADILEGPSEPEISQISDSKAETATSSLGPESGVFSMSLQDEFQVAAVGSSVDSVDHLSSTEAAKATEGQAEMAERMPTFVNFEQRVNERKVEKTVESTETLQETEATFVSKTEEEKTKAKKSQDAFMADGVSEEIVSTDLVQSIDASDAESAGANIKVEEGNQQQLIKEPSIEALVEQASLDDIAALADLQTIEGEDKSVRDESLADADIVQMAEKEQAVESQSNVADITQSEDNVSEISEVSETAEVRESKQQQEMGSERAELMPGEIALEADANVDNTEVKPANLLADAKVDVEEARGDDTLVLRADVDISEEKYAQEEDGLRMSASVDTEQVVFTPKVTQVPEDVSVQPGETIQLVSEVQGSPAPEVKWFKEGDTVKPTERISLLADNDIYTLEIREATGSDAGTYTLTAHNSEGTIFSDVQVTVNVPQDQGAVGGATGGGDVSVTATLSAPEFVLMPEDTSVQEFEQLQVFCSVKGTPTPEVKWQREGQTLQADSHMRIFESDGCHFLEIPQASFLDSGEYECIATNSEGTVSVVIRLTVEGVTDIDESGLSTNEDLRVAMSERSDTDVSTESATRRYIKLVGAAAAFTLVAFGINKIVQVLPKGS